MKFLLSPARSLGLLCVLSLSFLTQAAQAQDTIPLDPAVRKGTLPNGLTYYIRKNQKPEKRVELRLAVNTGSVQEDDDQLGMAHLVEHMCFRGTKRFPDLDVIHYLQSIGADFGPDINAYTSFDETVYMLSLPADSEDILTKGIHIMEDWASTVTFDDAVIDKERNVVLEEWRLGRGAGQRMRDKWIPVLLQGSKYAQRLPIGTKESILTASHEAIRRFYKEWYRPDNMAFVIVGDIDPDKMEAAIKAGFGAIPAREGAQRPVASYAVPDHKEELSSIVSDKENTQNSVILAWKTPYESIHTTKDLRASLLSDLFTAMLNQRLSELTQQANPPFLYAGSQYGHFISRSKDAFIVSLAYADGGFDRGLTATLTETERVRRHGFTEAELERAKKVILRNLEQGYKERDKTQNSQLIAEYVQLALGGDAAPGIAYEYEFVKAQLPGITLAEINPLISRYISSENHVSILMGVEKEGVKLPTEDQLKAITASVAQSKIDPYSEKKLAESLLPEKPKAGSIVAERTVAELGTTEFELSNGITVVLRPTDFQNDQILFTAFRDGGQSNFPVEYKLSGELAGNYLSEAGVGAFSKIDLQKFMAGKKAAVSSGIGLYQDFVSGNCSNADLETLFQLAYLRFTQPRRDETALSSLSTRMQAGLKNALSNPQVYFRNETEKIHFKNHPRDEEVLPSDEEWSNLKLDRIMELLSHNFGNARGYTFIFVGSFTVEKIRPLIETYLASLPSSAEKPAYKDLNITPVDGPFTQDIYKGADPKSLAVYLLEGDTAYSMEDSHRLWSLSNILERVLIDKLREDMTGVYGLGVSGAISRIPHASYHFRLQIPCAPDNVDKLLDAALAEIRRIQTDGLKPEELQKELESQRRAYEKDAKENRAWLRKLDQIKRNGEPNTRLAAPEKLLELVTADELKRVANQYLHLDKGLRFTLYPEGYQKKPATEETKPETSSAK